MVMLGMVILVPVYILGKRVDCKNLEKTGIANIQRDCIKMIAPLMYFVAFSLFGYHFV